MNRVSVVGCPGSGKTTFASALAERIGASYLELDSLYHQPDWQPLPDDEFRSAVKRLIEGDRWVVDGNYSKVVKPLVWEAADTVIWLDPPRYRAMWLVWWRTVRRIFLRQELWNGNRESWRMPFRTKPEENLLLWTWIHHGRYRREYAAAMNGGRYDHLTFKRLSGRRHAARFLQKVGAD